MKRSIILLLSLSLLLGVFVSCTPAETTTPAAPSESTAPVTTPQSGDTATPSVTAPAGEKTPHNALSLAFGLLSKTDVPVLSMTQVLNENSALRELNRGVGFGDQYTELTKIEGFKSGILLVPEMMPSVELLCIMEFENDKNFERYSKALKGLQHYAVCMGPNPKYVYVAQNGNFLIYVSVYHDTDGDLGKKIRDDFLAADLRDRSKLLLSEKYSAKLEELEG